MSMPYGAPQQQPGASGPAQPAAGLNLGLILPLAAAGLGLVVYLLAFADDVASGGSVLYLMAAGALAGLTVLPKALKLLPAAAVLAVVTTLLYLQGIIKSSADVKGMDIVLVIVALLETAAIVGALLLDAGIVKFEPKPPNPYGQPGGWNPQSGGFPPQGHGHPQQQFGQQQPQQQQQPPAGQFGAPVQPQQPNQGPGPTSYLPQPGQFGQGQQPGTPPGGFPPQG